MTEPWDFECDHFATGAVGEPGQRTFFLQGAEGKRVVTLKCEKQQVGALAEYLSRILADLPGGPSRGVPSRPISRSRSNPRSPWAALALGYDESRGSGSFCSSRSWSPTKTSRRWRPGGPSTAAWPRGSSNGPTS